MYKSDQRQAGAQSQDEVTSEMARAGAEVIPSYFQKADLSGETPIGLYSGINLAEEMFKSRALVKECLRN